jgi:hypothetical protein
MYHNGWLSVYDAIGLIGGALYLVFSLSLVWKSGRMVFAPGVDRSGLLFPPKVWLFANVTTIVVAFFSVYGDIKVTFPILCYNAVFWTLLNRLEKQGYKKVPLVREVPFDAARSGLPVVV